ncbi:MAG: hypothetical protein HYY36_05870, partial [Gammaproteobacteria bacterium]|nr:hypothetical protein [Gammaproteobacteria bacterium]
AVQGLAGPHGDIAYQYGVLVLALIMVIYGTLGGMRAVAWTDVVQGGVMMLGFLLLYVVLVYQFGPLSAATDRLAASPDPVIMRKVLPPDGDGLREWLSYILMVGMGAALYPQAIQRIYAAGSERVLRRSFAVMVFLPFITVWIAVVAGIYGAAYIPGLEGAGADQVLTRLFRRVQEDSVFGYGLIVILFAAVISAIMSTADSALLSISSMLTKDIYGRFIGRGSTESHLTRLGKIASWCLIGVLIWLAIALKDRASLIDLLDRKFDLLVQLVPAFMLGLRWRGLRAAATLAGLLTGLLLAIGLIVLPLDFVRDGKVWGLHPGLFGLVANLAVAAGGSLLPPGSGKHAAPAPRL